jgi:5-(carboxyamino)imidazole ribonucleotide synthase
MKNVLVLGAGQLARMMSLAGTPLNIDVKAFDVRTNKVINPVYPQHIYGELADGITSADVITAEFEHIAHDVLTQCETSKKLYPSSCAIKTGGDRRLEKKLLSSCDIPNAKHVVIESKEDFDSVLTKLSLPVIFKSALEGYDGKGQWRMKSADQATQLWLEMSAFIESATSSVPQGIIAEQMVHFDREVSLVGARSTTGEIAVYPLTENHHDDGILSISIATKPDQALQEKASAVFKALAEELNYVGILAIEFFQIGGDLLVNEIAPRVHNSGHWTQQGAETCQFENHLRATLGLPLGNTELIRPTAMINIIGEDHVTDAVMAIPSVNVHWYGKEKRAGRKMGHINVSGVNEEQLSVRLQQLADLLSPVAFSEVKPFTLQYFK